MYLGFTIVIFLHQCYIEAEKYLFILYKIFYYREYSVEFWLHVVKYGYYYAA
jgi:hypothetical protein